MKEYLIKEYRAIGEKLEFYLRNTGEKLEPYLKNTPVGWGVSALEDKLGRLDQANKGLIEAAYTFATILAGYSAYSHLSGDNTSRDYFAIMASVPCVAGLLHHIKMGAHYRPTANNKQ